MGTFEIDRFILVRLKHDAVHGGPRSTDIDPVDFGGVLIRAGANVNNISGIDDIGGFLNRFIAHTVATRAVA